MIIAIIWTTRGPPSGICVGFARDLRGAAPARPQLCRSAVAAHRGWGDPTLAPPEGGHNGPGPSSDPGTIGPQQRPSRRRKGGPRVAGGWPRPEQGLRHEEGGVLGARLGRWYADPRGCLRLSFLPSRRCWSRPTSSHGCGCRCVCVAARKAPFVLRYLPRVKSGAEVFAAASVHRSSSTDARKPNKFVFRPCLQSSGTVQGAEGSMEYTPHRLPASRGTLIPTF